jgi:hypothetical protein
MSDVPHAATSRPTQTNAVLVYLDSRAARRDMPTLREFKGSDCVGEQSEIN